jgi:outer membrane protein TolC
MLGSAMKSVTSGITLLAIIGIFLPLNALAQTSAADSLELSFAHALEQADENNAQIQAALMNLEKADAQIGEAWSAALPSLSAAGTYSRNFIVPEILVEMPGQDPVKFRFTQDNVWAGQVTLNQTLYAAGRVGQALKIAQLYRQATEEQVALSRSEVKLLVTQLYFGAVLAQEGETIARQTYEQMKDHLKQVEAMRREGMVSDYDVIRSQVQVSNFYPQVLAAESNRTVTYEALSIALGLPRAQPLNLTDGMDTYDVPDLPTTDLFNIALQRRSELKQLDLQSRIQQRLITIEQHGVIWPNLALTGGFSANAQAPDFNFKDYYWSQNLYAGLALSIPIFDGFKAKYRTQQVRADLKNLEIQRDQLQKGINLEIIQARDKFNQAQKNLIAQSEGVRLAQKGLDIANVQYANGLTTQLDVMDAQIALNQAQINLLVAHYDQITAQAQLENAIGAP